MGKRIQIDLNPGLEPGPEIVIDAAPIAQALALETATFLHLLNLRKIDQLCERGIDDDAGLYRASFYYQRQRVRLVVDRKGRQQGEIESSERALGGQR